MTILMSADLPVEIRHFNENTLRQIRSGTRLQSMPESSVLEHTQDLLRGISYDDLANPRDRKDFLLAKCLLAEVLDRRGRYRDATPWLADADQLLVAPLAAQSLPSEADELHLFVQTIWFGVHRSINDHRVGQLKSALKRSTDLYELLKRFRLDDRFSDLQFRLRLTLGRHHQAQDLDEAERYYGEALEYAASRVDWIYRNDPSNVQRLEEETRFARFNTAVLSVHLARCFLYRGDLTKARGQLVMAQVMLRDTDEITYAYVNFLNGCVHRQRTGELDQAIRVLRSSLDAFKAASHLPFYRRCRYELAKACFNREDYSEAERVLRSNISKDDQGQQLRDDPDREEVWSASTGLLAARIAYAQDAQGNSSLALNQARRAKEKLKEVEKQDSPNRARIRELLVQASLVLANIASSKGDLSGALIECKEAEKLRPVDTTDQAWLMLERWEVYLRQGEIGRALAQQTQFNAILPHMENQHMRARARELEGRLLEESNKGFWYGPKSEHLTWKELSMRLQEFLLRRAAEQGKEDLKLSQELGFKNQQTIRNWRNERNKLKPS